jgi:TolA-binding protein
MHRIGQVAFALCLAAGLAFPAAAQTSGTVSQSDIQRLQDNVYSASSDISQLRSRDTSRAGQLQSELDDLRDEVVYLKVKLRKDRTVPRSEYVDVRDRIEDLRTRARGEGTNAFSTPSSSAPSSSTTTRSAQTTTRGTTGTQSGLSIPSGTELDVRLLNTLNSGTAQVEDRFEASTLVDLTVDGRNMVPAGSVMRGVVTAVEPGTRTNRTSKMTVSFDQLTVNGRSYPIRATVTQAIQGEGIKGELPRTGVGAGVGAVLGGLLGGVKGAVLGAVIGAGGTVVATEGKEVELPQGTTLRVRFDAPVQLNR